MEFKLERSHYTAWAYDELPLWLGHHFHASIFVTAIISWVKKGTCSLSSTQILSIICKKKKLYGETCLSDFGFTPRQSYDCQQYIYKEQIRKWDAYKLVVAVWYQQWGTEYKVTLLLKTV